eukprot:6340538-Amphidinium_carterae.1
MGRAQPQTAQLCPPLLGSKYIRGAAAPDKAPPNQTASEKCNEMGFNGSLAPITVMVQQQQEQKVLHLYHRKPMFDESTNHASQYAQKLLHIIYSKANSDGF